MPVPDNVVFGPNEHGGQLTYGQVRGLTEDARIRALKCRFDTFLVQQTRELAQSSDGGKKVYAPFPLFLLTCVAIETLGKVLYFKQNIQEEDAQRDGFLIICKSIDPQFSRPLSKTDKEAYDSLWGAGAHEHAKSPGHILYRFGRHTMVHGFRGKGVYITEREETPKWDFSGGAIAINPYWFWKRFEAVHEEEWQDLFANREPTNARKKAALLYLSVLLS